MSDKRIVVNERSRSRSRSPSRARSRSSSPPPPLFEGRDGRGKLLQREEMFSSQVYVKLLTGQTLSIAISDVMTVDGFNYAVREAACRRGVALGDGDAPPRLLFGGKVLTAWPGDTFVTCAHECLWCEACVHVLPPAR